MEAFCYVHEVSPILIVIAFPFGEEFEFKLREYLVDLSQELKIALPLHELFSPFFKVFFEVVSADLLPKLVPLFLQYTHYSASIYFGYYYKLEGFV